jgi:hypothetical protein
MGTPEGHQKSIYNTPPVKKKKDTYGIYPTKFASSTQQHKKVNETPNQPIEIKKILNKRMFSTLKVKRRQKLVWELAGENPTKLAGSTQNPKKVIRTSNLPIRTKIFHKTMFRTLKV